MLHTRPIGDDESGDVRRLCVTLAASYRLCWSKLESGLVEKGSKARFESEAMLFTYSQGPTRATQGRNPSILLEGL